MNFISLHTQDRNIPIAAGKLLIAEPLLKSPDFSRTVILICKHDDEGTVGFVLNQPTSYMLGDMLPDFYAPGIKLSIGGPVEPGTMYVIHRLHEELGGYLVNEGIYWGVETDELSKLLKSGRDVAGDIAVFMGYSGWSSGQLEQEMKEGSWLVADSNEHFVFDTITDEKWKKAIELLGKKLAYLANVPINPHLN